MRRCHIWKLHSIFWACWNSNRYFVELCVHVVVILVKAIIIIIWLVSSWNENVIFVIYKTITYWRVCSKVFLKQNVNARVIPTEYKTNVCPIVYVTFRHAEKHWVIVKKFTRNEKNKNNSKTVTTRERDAKIRKLVFTTNCSNNLMAIFAVALKNADSSEYVKTLLYFEIRFF